ncbi:MAG TPA: hypothetical protein PLH65_02125 [bacterium]|nr:hypothetical protein [bacterium]
MEAKFWLISLLMMVAIVAFGIIYSAINDPEVKKLNFWNVGSVEQPHETMVDQAKDVADGFDVQR